MDVTSIVTKDRDLILTNLTIGARRLAPESLGFVQAHYPEPLTQALKQLRALVKGERYLVAWARPAQQLEVVAAFGFDVQKIFVSEALSMSLLLDVAQTGEARWSDEDLTCDGSLTFMLAGIKSYICVPVKFPEGLGILYTDDRKVVARFNYTDYANVLNLARRLVSPAEPGQPARPLPNPKRGAMQPPVDSPTADLRPLPMAQQVNFFRCLATFLQAGIPLLHALYALGEQGETPRLKSYCKDLHRQLLRGSALSEACQKLGGFSAMVQHMLVCAEKSGQLASVLKHLSEYLEEGHARKQRLGQAMVYPAIVLLVCLAMAVILPTYVLRDQLRGYAAMGPLPWPTQVLVWVGNLASSPWLWGALILWVAMLPGMLRRLSKMPALQRGLHRLLLGNPLTGRLYRARQEVTLATALQLQLQAGVPLLESLRGSFQACSSPLIEASAPQLIDQVRQGEPLAKVFQATPGLSRPFCQMIQAGEETGHVVRALDWVARSAKLDFDLSLDTALRLVEPVVMVLMGLVVGVITLGSLLPSLNLLERL
jgi:type II secretory pathway component PulF